MSRNRISYNIQDVFVGSPSGVTNFAITGATGTQGFGYEILKRINKVQDFNYSFDLPRENVGVLGKTSSVSAETASPPSVNIDFSYIPAGVNNEVRMGLSVEKQKSLFPEAVPVQFISGLLDGTTDKSNIYLAIKGDGEGDIRDYYTGDYPFPPTGTIWNNIKEVGDPNAGDDNYIVFQNCYINKYDVTFGVNQLGKVSIGAVADNAIFQKGLTTGVGIPYVSTTTAQTGFRSPSIAVPKYINPNTSRALDNPNAFLPSQISATITKRPGKTVYASSFAVELSPFGFQVQNGTATWSSSYGGKSNVLRFNGNTTNNSHAGFTRFAGELTVGKRYKLKGKFYVDTAGGNYKGMLIRNDASVPLLDFHSTAGNMVLAQWKDFETTFVALNNDLYFYPTNSAGSTSFAATTADNFGIKDIVITEDQTIDFNNNTLQSIDVSLDLARDNISYLGHKLYADRSLQYPINLSVGFDYVVSGDTSGDLQYNFKENELYDLSVDFVTGNMLAMNYNISGLTLESAGYSSAIGSNKALSLAFKGEFDLDDDKKGFFVSGRVINLRMITFASGQKNDAVVYVTDDAGNYLGDTSSQMLFPEY